MSRKSWIIDIVLLAVLFGIGVIMDALEPFTQDIPPDPSFIASISYPFKEDTIPVWLAVLLGVLCAVFSIGFFQINPETRNFHEAKVATYGFFVSGGTAWFITGVVKKFVGRYRPDFLYRCYPEYMPTLQFGVPGFPDDIEQFWSQKLKRGVIACTGSNSLVRKGRQSFPSGHASFSFACAGYCTLYLLWRLRPRSARQRWTVLSMTISFLPCVGALLVAISRVTDYRHHWQDVTIGSIIGLVCSWIAYRANFPELFWLNKLGFSQQLPQRPSGDHADFDFDGGDEKLLTNDNNMNV